jgi:hypothetical protein
MALYDLTGSIVPSAADLVLDTRYTVPLQASVPCFCQDGDDPLVFAVPTSPIQDATGVQIGNSAQAHFISIYTNTASLTATVNGVATTVSITATIGGILVATTGRLLERDPNDGLCHLHMQGTEDVAGAVSIDWTFVPVPRVQMVSPAVMAISVRPWMITDAVMPVYIRATSVAPAVIQLNVRAPNSLTGYAVMRLIVGDVFTIANQLGSTNIAESFLAMEHGGALEIEGYAVFDQATGALEIKGASTTTGVGSGNVAVLFLDDAQIASLELGHLNTNSDDPGSANILGEQSQVPEGYLVVRVSALPDDVFAELEAAGIKFSFRAPPQASVFSDMGGSVEIG